MHMYNLAEMELFTLVKAYSSLMSFDLRFLEWSRVVSNLQILFECDLAGKGSPEKDCHSC